MNTFVLKFIFHILFGELDDVLVSRRIVGKLFLYFELLKLTVILCTL